MDYLRRLILRDRNHPSVVLWSIGNEEWALESNHRGARMAEIMQAYARQFDTTRPFNAAVSGSWGQGISSVDRKSTRLNSSHVRISYAVFCLKKKKAPFTALS